VFPQPLHPGTRRIARSPTDDPARASEQAVAGTDRHDRARSREKSAVEREACRASFPRVRRGTLRIVGVILFFAWLIASWIVDLLAVYLTFGGLAVLLGIVLAPIVFVIAPWYAGLAHGFWWPLIVEYGGLVVLGLVFGLAEKLFSTRE